MADARLVRLKVKQRTATRNHCTTLLQQINNLELPLTADTLITVENQAGKLSEYKTKLTELNEAILLHMDEETDDLDAETVVASDLDDQILEATQNLKNSIKQYRDNIVPVAAPVDNNNHAERRVTVHLPKLHIQKFSGEALKWQEFWDSFENTIHNNEDLSPIDKFKYLRSLLTGDALRHIVGYSLTAENYQTVVESLKERFGNKQLAIFSHFEAMLALPVASYDTAQLQRNSDECELHIRSLIALGLHEDTFGQVFTPIILSKLPPFVKMELYRRNGNNAWTLQALREFLKEEIRIRDMSYRTFGSKPDKPSSSGRPHNRSAQGTSASLLADSSEAKEKTVRCSLCAEQHYTDQCKTYQDLKTRKAHLKGRCLRCLSGKHLLDECPSTVRCWFCKEESHHRALCPKKFGKVRNSSNTDTNLTTTADSDTDSESSESTTLLSHGETVIMQTALTQIRTSKQTPEASARLLFDTGCTRTFITSDLATKINAQSMGEEQISVAGFNATKRKTATYKIVKFEVIQADGTPKTLTANVTKTISCPIQKKPINIKSYPVAKNLRLAEPIVSTTETVNIDVLIGSDYYYDFVGCERITCPDGLIFLASTLGFIITGRLESPHAKTNIASSLLLSRIDVAPDKDIPIERFWTLEDIGVKSSEVFNDDDEAQELFNKSIQFKDGRYHVSWPWKKKEPELPSNYQLANGRLKSLYKRINEDKKILEQYDKTIQDQKTKGVIEEAPEVPSSDLVHYIPHHAVITPQKTTTKLRIVYDASAKMSKASPSLNDCLHRGPVLLDNLCGLIIRFRLKRIALVSDIEKAFLQVGLNDEARDVTRFLWIKDLTKPPTADNIIIYRFCRVPFGMNSSPFLLAGTIQHHTKKENTDTAKEISENLYVDNLMNGKDTVEEAIGFYTETKNIFNRASMNIREWYTNNEDVRASFKEEDCGQTEKTKVLGLEWNTHQDTLRVNGVDTQSTVVDTKRLVLKNLAKVFDPCGYFAAVTVSCKILMQEIWKETFQWDDKLPKEIIDKWVRISKDLAEISDCVVPRCILPPSRSPTEFQIHCFCDASTKAYAAVVYLRMISGGHVSTELIFAKSRVAPLKTMTVPRLELMAVLVGTRLCKFVEDNMRISVTERVVWSDSQCVLHWIAKEEITGIFVRNRVNEIKQHTATEFRYVPTDINPADIASRGCSLKALSQNDLWWHGPEFISLDRSYWPQNIVPASKLDDAPKMEVHLSVGVDTPSSQCLLIDFRKFSNLNRLLRTVAWIFRFIHNLKNTTKMSTGLTAKEIIAAKQYCIQLTQREAFQDILTQKNVKNASQYKQLGLFKDEDGILRCEGRLQFADISDEAKFPVLLPKNHPFTNLVIQDCHEKLLHGGVSHTLAQVRTRFWVPQGRSQVKKIRNRCPHCRLRLGGPFRVPDFPPLPEFRLKRERPFSSVGLDYLGPLHIKDIPTQTQKKVWICLFTCAVTRAVHLEVAEQLSAEHFLLCLRRFSSRYGKPKLIVSDNGKQFHATNNALSKQMRRIENSQKVQDCVTSSVIEWKFITEISPWMGGFYERMVGLVKRCLKNSLDSRCVSLSELQTVISEVSAIINSRPLVYVGSEVSESILTPAHFLGGPFPILSGDCPDDQTYGPVTVNSTQLVHSYRRLQNIVDNFWKQFHNQYILSLRGNKYGHKQTGTSEYQPVVGSIVQVKDSCPRNLWKLGKIISVKPSNDGFVRSATVEMFNKKKLTRPIKLLYPLELEADVGKDPIINVKEDNTRSKRKAAKIATCKIKAQLGDEMDGDSSGSD